MPQTNETIFVLISVIIFMLLEFMLNIKLYMEWPLASKTE